jgi:hypothetical protein
VHTAVTLAYLGYIDQARSWIREAFAEASRLEHVYQLAFVSIWDSWVECVAGSPYATRRPPRAGGVSAGGATQCSRQPVARR